MPRRLTCEAVFQTERRGEEPAEYWGPEGAEGYGPCPLGRKGRTLLGQGGDEPGEGRGCAVGQDDLPAANLNKSSSSVIKNLLPSAGSK